MHRKDPIAEDIHRVRESIAREAGCGLTQRPPPAHPFSL